MSLNDFPEMHKFEKTLKERPVSHQCKFCPTIQSINCQTEEAAKACAWRKMTERERLPKMTKAERAILRQIMQ